MPGDELTDRLSSVLNRAQEHVAKGERLIARQKELVAEIASRGADVSRYESLLAILEEAQRLHLAHRDRLTRDLEELWRSGRRSGNAATTRNSPSTTTSGSRTVRIIASA